MGRGMELGLLGPKQILSDEDLVVSQDEVKEYLGAIPDSSKEYIDYQIVPPLALVAFALARAMKILSLPAGTIHTGQEANFSAGIKIGDLVRCTIQMEQNSTRNGFRFVKLGLSVSDGTGEGVRAVTSLIIPENGEQL